MKNRNKQLRVGLVPTRREAFANETTTKQKKAIVDRFRRLAAELDFEMVDIEDINEEGMLMTYRDVEAAYDKLTAAKVDALIFPHCNFGQEEAVGRLAKDMNLPVLIWGPRDGYPNGLEWRPTDSQCGMFATTKLLMHYGVTFSYIENCELESDILREELADFLAAANVVKAFRALRIARISSRPKEFLSVMVNEAELLEKYDIEIVPGEPTVILDRVDRILAEDRDRMEELLKSLTDAGLDISALGENRYPLAAIELALLDFAEDNDCNALSCECWNLFRKKYGVSPCFILGDLNDRGLPAAFRKLIPLYNRTEHRLGCVLAGTENLHKEIARGVRNNTKGYDEIDSRLGRSYIELPGATEQDVKEICTANGLDDATADRIWNEVDKIKRYVKVTNKRGETKEKNLFFCEDLRRLMRLVKREQIANQFGQM